MRALSENAEVKKLQSIKYECLFIMNVNEHYFKDDHTYWHKSAVNFNDVFAYSAQ